MAMTPDEFFDIMLTQEPKNEFLSSYYKFLKDSKNFLFRKNYFLSRLHYIYEQLIQKKRSNHDIKVWDCGCGYGTTGIFLAMNGIRSHGTTLHFFDEIRSRTEFWSQFGDTQLFSYDYEDLFDQTSHQSATKYDYIIIQDTLHHIEPIDQALDIFYSRLKSNGKLLAIEENGDNIIQNMILYKRRGNKRIISIWDDKLEKNVLLGNENIRGLSTWASILKRHKFNINSESITYYRYYLPFVYKLFKEETLLDKEKIISAKRGLRTKYLFFGLNFIAEK